MSSGAIAGGKELLVEKVTHIPNPAGYFIPKIAVQKKSIKGASNNNTNNPFGDDTNEDGGDGEAEEETVLRSMEASDMMRILDFNNVPEPPADCPMLHCEYDVNGKPTFPRRYVALRGGYLFYFDLADVSKNDDHPYRAAPLGVVPLTQTVVEFPPGGRRVFREHSDTEAQKGYEMEIKKRVRTGEEYNEKEFPPAYLAAESLGQRDGWAAALRVRAEVWKKDTVLRPGGVSTRSRAPAAKASPAAGASSRFGGLGASERSRGRRNSLLRPKPNAMDSISGLEGGDVAFMSEDEEADVNAALEQFGITGFKEEDWIDDFFQNHSEFDAPGMCEKLETWQNSVKLGLRGKVLEQYKYFVEGSKEMTTMGREVAALRGFVEQQQDCIETMKNIDFATAFADPGTEEYGYSSEESDGEDSVSSSDASNYSTESEWDGRSAKSGRSKKGLLSPKKQPTKRKDLITSSDENNDNNNKDPTLIEIPAWLNDSIEEISAYIRQCQYTDATDLLLKAKTEVTDILNQHDKLTDRKLSRKQLSTMTRILQSISNLTERMTHRLAEGLRRKNEALKQAAKRERADPLSVLAPLVSPICLNDDAIALSLLVKLGKPQDAATAYAARRSLLLMESLHERPISSAGTTGTMDVVIYAAQLSQSFFSCLAMAVEGFLDLFMEHGGTQKPHNALGRLDDDDQSSLHSTVGKKVPAGALAAIVLWCDSELLKFSAAFGGTRVLGNLQLAPPARGGVLNSTTLSASKKNLNQPPLQETITEQKIRLRQAEEMGEFAAAAALRQKITDMEQEERKNRAKGVGGGSTNDLRAGASSDNKDRQAAVEIAAKCVDQAFQFASENLDSIGLPLTPRLAYYIRSRLKGCEAEIATLLEGRWDHITFDWVNSNEMEGISDNRRQRIGELRATSTSTNQSDEV